MRKKSIEEVHIRSGVPTRTNENKKGVIYKGFEVEVAHEVEGENIDGNNKWYRDKSGDFLWSGGFEGEDNVEDIATVEFDVSQFWWIKDFGIDELWARGLTGRGIKVAILDSGLSLPHPDLIIDISKTADKSESNQSGLHDISGHGTHCIGIINGSDNGFGIKGIAYNSDIYFCKVTNDQILDDLYYVKKGLEWALEQDVDIISISHGNEVDNADLRPVLQRLAEKDVICITAAGNQSSGSNKYNEIFYPALYDECLAVGAVNKRKEFIESTIISESLDIAAPGDGILSTFKDKSYTRLSGSSQAAPFVTSVLALLLEYVKNNNISISNAELKGLLLSTGDNSQVCPIINPIKTFNSLESIQ